MSTKTLDELLQEIDDIEPGEWENDDGPLDWWAVGNQEGIIAYLGTERDAYRFRLDYINRLLNP